MTFTISIETFYFVIVIILMIIQIYQWSVIQRLKSEVTSIWNQIQLLTINIAAEIVKLKKLKSDETEEQKEV